MPGIGGIVNTLEIVGPSQHVPHIGNILILVQQQLQHLTGQLLKVKRFETRITCLHQNHLNTRIYIACYWVVCSTLERIYRLYLNIKNLQCNLSKKWSYIPAKLIS